MSHTNDINLECKPVLVIKGHILYTYAFYTHPCDETQTGMYEFNFTGIGSHKTSTEVEGILSNNQLGFWEFDNIEEANDFVSTMLELESA